MRGLDVVAPCQIRDGAREFEDAMVRPRRQIHLTHRRSHQALTFILQFAKLTNFFDTHVGIADNVRPVIRETFLLNVSCLLHPLAD